MSKKTHKLRIVREGFADTLEKQEANFELQLAHAQGELKEARIAFDKSQKRVGELTAQLRDRDRSDTRRFWLFLASVMALGITIAFSVL